MSTFRPKVEIVSISWPRKNPRAGLGPGDLPFGYGAARAALSGRASVAVRKLGGLGVFVERVDPNWIGP
jgi:hypothetical protein